jgi:hypothetical protein
MSKYTTHTAYNGEIGNKKRYSRNKVLKTCVKNKVEIIKMPF